MNPYLLIDLKQIYLPKSPTDHYSTLKVMGELSHRSQVICALESAKMVFPIWKEYLFNKNFSKEQQEIPEKAIETIEKWLEGKATQADKAELEQIAFDVGAIATSHYITSAYVCYCAVITVTGSGMADSTINNIGTIPLNPASTATFSITNAVSGGIDYAAGTFITYKDWWNRCYPLIEKELQTKYDILCNQILEDL